MTSASAVSRLIAANTALQRTDGCCDGFHVLQSGTDVQVTWEVVTHRWVPEEDIPVVDSAYKTIITALMQRQYRAEDRGWYVLVQKEERS